VTINRRLTRATMLETPRQDYVRTARAKGSAERMVVCAAPLKNALIPIVTVVGVQAGYLLGVPSSPSRVRTGPEWAPSSSGHPRPRHAPRAGGVL